MAAFTKYIPCKIALHIALNVHTVDAGWKVQSAENNDKSLNQSYRLVYPGMGSV